MRGALRSLKKSREIGDLTVAYAELIFGVDFFIDETGNGVFVPGGHLAVVTRDLTRRIFVAEMEAAQEAVQR